MITRFKPDFGLEEIKCLINNKDDSIEKFEELFAKTVNNKYAISFPSGRSGLFSILKTLNLTKNEIILPSYSCIVLPPSIISIGSIPRFVDISLFDYNIKIEDITKVISNKTKAIIPTYMYGNPCDVKKIRDIIGEDIFIIEDAAQAILTKDVGKYGDAVFYSFNYEKQIFTFGGGMVTTNNKDLYDKLIKFRNNNFKNPRFIKEFTNSFLLLNTPLIFSNMFFRFILAFYELSGFRVWKKNGWSLNNSNLPVIDIYLAPDLLDAFTKIQASVGLSQINKIKENIEKRIRISKFYNEKLKDIKSFILPSILNGSSYSHYTIRTKNRDDFERYMKRKGIQVNKVFDYSLPHLPVYSKYSDSDMKYSNSYTAGKNNVNLPLYPQLFDNKNYLEKIVNSLIEYDQSKK